MENRNVLIAIILSSLVLLIWATVFEPPPMEPKTDTQTEKILNEDVTSPSVDESKQVNLISRDAAIKEKERIKIENENIVGSISLIGALIDDITFKKYKQKLDGDEKVIFLNPASLDSGYFIETGWAASGANKISVPNNNSKWIIKGNNVLTPGNPVFLEWDNSKGLIFKKTIQLDDKFLFTVVQSVTNNTTDTIELYPYSQITRNRKPEVTKIYILHEGFLGVFDEELSEEDYDDIEENKFVKKSEKGWLGITDKYWLTAIVPETSKNFKSEFKFNKSYKANFIITEPTILTPNSTKQSEIRIFTAAKQVKEIDNYAEQLNIQKFDLAIDWGWFYFFTKPLFFVIDYFFKLSGNFGMAIVMTTACIRLIFFPLANYSFRSMAKMKVLQPEMTRLKELHKNDKTRLQQEMMALYKKEKVNPISGCLPVVIQIPFFFAIYKMLYVTLEMRHQPFFGWIEDLSARDPTSIFNLFGLIPWDPPTFLMIGVWPILMGLTMYLQQKLNPAPPDPIQAKIFMFFPLFLTIILAPFPSGLVVYWTVNNILTIAQQWIIMRGTKVKTV